MNSLTRLRTLGLNDVKLVRRDSLLWWMMGIPIVYALVLRWGLPPLAEWLEPRFDLMQYSFLIVSYILISVPPIIFGMVIGFLLLDERDDGTLMALRVTPMPFTLYILYRVAVPQVLSAVTTVVAVPLSGVVTVTPLPLVLAASLAATEAGLVTLLLGAYAQNKVQGFAIMKGFGGITVLPVVAYFMPEGWQLLAGVFPNYWPVKLFWMEDGAGVSFWIYLAVGAAYHAALFLVLLKKFQRLSI